LNRTNPGVADAQSWALLLALSLIWGGSFLFVGIAIKELPPLLIVLARVGMAAAILIPVHMLLQGPIPRDAKTWAACGFMSVMNNVLPFTAIAWGQQYIESGLASVINATTPIFAVLSLALFGMESLSKRKIFGIVVGVAGVVILKGAGFGTLGPQMLGILAVVFASVCYGFSSPWSKTKLVGIPPLTIATCQLAISTIIMAVIVGFFAEPVQYANASGQTWLALLLLAAVSTSFAYLIFFRIIQRAGPAFVSLVTMVIPISAIALGYAVLGERLDLHELIGAAIIGVALLIIDGRFMQLFKAAQ
jgi:drug/metabolite transporter (DMT)-like permease